MDTASAHQIYPGSRLGKCYRVEKVLGEGGFGFVTKCCNTETNEMVAIKVNKSHPNVVHETRKEIFILKKLRCLDPDTCNIVKWNGFFFDKDRVCLDFELLDQSLRGYFQCRDNNGLTMTELRPIIHQLATALHHLSSVGIAHRDLKPENVMIVNRQQKPLQVKLIDFGLACPVSKIRPNMFVGTLYYMAPEVMLEMPYNEAVDMWALGLLVAELAIGYTLYPGDTVYEMLYMITETQGLPPDHVLDRGMGTEYYFNRPRHGQQHHWTFKPPEQFVDETGEYPPNLGYADFNCLDDIVHAMVKDGEDERDRHLLTDLIKRMLQLDPDQRIKPLEVLQHPFFTENLPESPRMDMSIEIRNSEETPGVCQIDQTSELQVNDSSVEVTDEKEETSDELAGALQIFPGGRLGQCYRVEKVLREGGFGLVTKCRNTETNEVVAIKCIKNHHNAVEADRKEIAVLEKLRCLDPDTCNIVKWNGFFFDKDHACLKFELLDQNLYKYMQCRYNNGLTTTELRPIIHQLATALYHLSSVEIVHRDLKPDNVMIVNHMEQPLKVKLIDFGLACPLSHINSNICVGTTWYMAPEVMLQMPYNEAVDMWSLGLLVAELAMGYPLYPGDTVYEMLHMITETQGLPPDHVLDRGMRSEHFFNRPSHSQQYWTFKPPKQFVDETGENPTDLGFVTFRCLDDIERMMVNDGEDERDRHLFTDLIKRMLQLDPDQRIKPLEVLQHPFFRENLPESPRVDTSIEIRNSEETPGVCQIDQTSGLHVNGSSVEDIVEQEETSDELAGALQIFPGGRLGKCYRVEKVLGEGGFGFVTKCCNTETNEMVAIKVNKSHPNVVHETRKEIFILKELRCLDPDTCNIVKWNGFFFDKDRVCLDFELLDQSLRGYFQCRDNNGLTMTELRPIIHQLATALHHLSSVGIAHRDLKPENAMIVNRQQKPLQVKLIDFGLACPVSKIRPNMFVGTLYYMAPEVMLEMPYNEAVDMWALGLLVAELAIGYTLYPGDTVYEMLYMITETQGLPPDHVLDRGMGTEYYFNRPRHGQQHHWTFKPPEQFVDETGEYPPNLGYADFNCLDDIVHAMVKDGEDERDRHLLTDLIKRMLQLDPDQRIKPLEVLQHPFFTENLPESPRMDMSIEIRNSEETPGVCQIDQTSELQVNDSSVEVTDEKEETSDELAGALQIFPGGRLGQCYRVEKVLREGGFGLVTKCRNTETNEVVAIKCIKNHHNAVEADRKEIAVLEKLRCLDPDTCNIVKWNGFFFDKDHACLKFELLDQNLYKYMQCRYNNGLTTTELRPIIHQLATALYHLSSVEIVHRDLKPDNVMIVNHMEQPLKVKLIDFGLACPLSHINSNICVGTTWYMAPEVMLQMPYNEAVDMWSLGLLVAELAMGYPLYPGDTVYEMLHMITETQGLPPDHVLDRGMRSEHFFNRPSHSQQYWTFKPPKQFVDETGENPTDLGFVTFRCLDDIERMMVNDGEDERDRHLFTDLIKRMLQLDPDQRIKPLEVLQHPFFRENLPESPRVDTSIEIRNSEETPGVCQIDQTSGLHVNGSSVEDIVEQEETSDELAGALQIFPGGRLGKCYRVEKVLGEGGFGFVTKCCNTETNEMVAIKVNKSHPNVVHETRKEIFILKELRCLDPDTCNIVKWNGFFFDKDRVCLDFELLDQSLRGYFQCRYNNGLTMTELRPIIHQLATALHHLSSVGIAHRDLKPENVMIVNRQQKPLQVKLIDFGLACPVSKIRPNMFVGTLYYMAPEVMLEMPYNEAVDMWALGLLVAELAIGYTLYPGDTVYEMLYMITETQGLPPDHVLDRGMGTEYYFNRPRHGQQHHWTFKPPEQFVDETGEYPPNLGYADFNCLDDIVHAMVKDGEDERDRHLLTDLIKRMLQLDPDQRIKPLEVLQHPFFRENLPESPRVDTSIEIRNSEETPGVCQIDQTSGLQVNDSSVEVTDEKEKTFDKLS